MFTVSVFIPIHHLLAAQTIDLNNAGSVISNTKTPPTTIILNENGKAISNVTDLPTTEIKVDPNKLPAPDKIEKWGFIDPLGGVKLPTIIGRIIRKILPFVGSLFFAMFVYGGFLWFTAGGDSKNVDKSKKTLRSAVIGLVIIMGAYALLDVVLSTLSSVIP